MHGLVLADSGDHKAAVALHSEAIEADGSKTPAQRQQLVQGLGNVAPGRRDLLQH